MIPLWPTLESVCTEHISWYNAQIRSQKVFLLRRLSCLKGEGYEINNTLITSMSSWSDSSQHMSPSTSSYQKNSSGTKNIEGALDKNTRRADSTETLWPPLNSICHSNAIGHHLDVSSVTGEENINTQAMEFILLIPCGHTPVLRYQGFL